MQRSEGLAPPVSSSSLPQAQLATDPLAGSPYRRREMLKTAARAGVGVALVPAISAVLVPTAAAQVSQPTAMSTPTRTSLSTDTPIPASTSTPAATLTPGASGQTGQASDIEALVQAAISQYFLRAAIVRVTMGGAEVITTALGEAMTGVPATTDMHFRNGAVAISYVATLLLRLVDQGVLSLDDPLSKWTPELPDADRVTLRMLASMTSGYFDYVRDADFNTALYADPFRQWTPQELISISVSHPHVFAPGTNWDYSHAGYVILGQALERATGEPMAMMLREQVLDPLGLNHTKSETTAAIQEPALHAFTSERRAALGIAPSTRFYEESTYWNPSWTLTHGAIQTTNIYDMTATAEAVGTGELLSPQSHQEQVAGMLGFGSLLEGCPTCHTLDQTYDYGLGVVLSRGWILQNPLLGGYGGIEGYLPSQQIAIAVATTYGEGAFDDEGEYKNGNASQLIFNAIAAYLAPDESGGSK